jgi:pimeloyl-ACP methyl ester carboxylesterase
MTASILREPIMCLVTYNGWIIPKRPNSPIQSSLQRANFIKPRVVSCGRTRFLAFMEQQMSAQTKPSIVFAHGLWADGSCFSKGIPALQADGHEVIAAQNSLDTLEGDVAAVKRALGRVGSPAILVGHSYGGTVITAAGTDNRVADLVYIAALAPGDDETSQSSINKFPTTEVFSHIEVADGRIWLRPEGIGSFAGDLSKEEQKVVWATQGVPAANLFDQKLAGNAWKSKPSWYIVAKNDRTVHPDLERFLAKRMGYDL